MKHSRGVPVQGGMLCMLCVLCVRVHVSAHHPQGEQDGPSTGERHVAQGAAESLGR